MKVVYQLVSFNLENKSGVFRMRKDAVGYSFKEINVGLSPLLISRLEKRIDKGLKVGDSLLGTKFSSTVNSQMFSENPFRLNQFVPEGKSDIPMNYQLALVFESKGILQEVIDAFGDKAHVWKNRDFRPKQYLRFKKYMTDKMLSDCDLRLNIINPNTDLC